MKNNQGFLWILDNGHGGMINGEYQTKGKRSPKWEDGKQLFEGEFNRKVVGALANFLYWEGIPHHILVPEERDISLKMRVSRVNEICKEHPNAVLVSIHANAGGGTGFEVFTSVGETMSDKIASVFCKQYQENLPEFRLRADKSDGDLDKESQFYVLRKTRCPAILTENLFMDNEKDCHFLMSEEGAKKIAATHARAIMKFEREYV